MAHHNLTDTPIIAFDDTGKIGPQMATKKVVYDIYYEWIDAENKWIKLINTDPDPINIPPGKYDGQIIAIKRPSQPSNIVQWKPTDS